MKRLIILMMLVVSMVSYTMAQTTFIEKDKKKDSKAWELGLGGSVFQFNRASFSNYSKQDNGYLFNLKLDHALWGGNIYVARELNSHFYLDLQGDVGVTKESINNDDQTKWLYMVGLGLQWRFGEYFGSKYIDPYVRAGVNYMHKDFNIWYNGTEGLNPDEMKWVMDNMHNKEGIDRDNLIPISAGVGLNMWLNDKWGIGMQGDYLIMPYKDVANSLQGTVRLMYRMGGKSKKVQPRVEYIETIVEKIIEKPVIVPTPVPETTEKEVEKLIFLDNVHFEFNSAILTAESNVELDKLATILLQDKSRKFLIIGYTDARGSKEYNETLSQKRANAVIDALVTKGVPRSMMIGKGVGSKISFAKPSDSDEVRLGDRKITIEWIKNMDYWNYLQTR